MKKEFKTSKIIIEELYKVVKTGKGSYDNIFQMYLVALKDSTGSTYFNANTPEKLIKELKDHGRLCRKAKK